MKKNYIYCILSLLIVVLGFLFILLGLLYPTLSPNTQRAILLYAICFILIGIAAFAVHYRKYNLLKTLMDNDLPILARWSFKPNSSAILTNTLKEYKHNALCTLSFTFILVLIFTCTFIATYLPTLSYLGPLISIIFLLVGIFIINAYFKRLSTEPIEVIWGEDLIYFLDDIYTLQKSIYFLDNVVINTEGEPTLQLIYGQIEYDDSPYFILEIPIPENQMKMAHVLCNHYLEEIKNINY